MYKVEKKNNGIWWRHHNVNMKNENHGRHDSKDN